MDRKLERRAFGEWYVKKYGNADYGDNDEHVQICWLGWQARAQQEREKLREVKTALRESNPNINHWDMELVTDFPDGTSLYVQENGVGGHTYYTDEIGCGGMVWDTAIASARAVKAALEHHEYIKTLPPQETSHEG